MLRMGKRGLSPNFSKLKGESNGLELWSYNIPIIMNAVKKFCAKWAFRDKQGLSTFNSYNTEVDLLGQ